MKHRGGGRAHNLIPARETEKKWSSPKPSPTTVCSEKKKKTFEAVRRAEGRGGERTLLLFVRLDKEKESRRFHIALGACRGKRTAGRRGEREKRRLASAEKKDDAAGRHSGARLEKKERSNSDRPRPSREKNRMQKEKKKLATQSSVPALAEGKKKEDAVFIRRRPRGGSHHRI